MSGVRQLLIRPWPDKALGKRTKKTTRETRIEKRHRTACLLLFVCVCDEKYGTRRRSFMNFSKDIAVIVEESHLSTARILETSIRVILPPSLPSAFIPTPSVYEFFSCRILTGTRGKAQYAAQIIDLCCSFFFFFLVRLCYLLFLLGRVQLIHGC